ncbi:MAG: hypothetical protein ACYC06_09410 [Ilumatobacteraceae bacterium]
MTDTEVAVLIAEAKPLPDGYLQRVHPKQKRGHLERELDLVGAHGSNFRLILRQSSFNPLDFSVILAWLPPQSTSLFRLCRYNGKSHEHTNALELNKFYAFHIHRATERYQQSGLREDAFAESTDRYNDLAGALGCLIQDCSFQAPANHQPRLFDTEGAP